MKPLKITLKNIKINESFSEETTMFMADLYVDGVKTAHCKNDGHGGSSWYHSYEGKHDLLKQAENFALSLPSIKCQDIVIKSDLEMIIDNLIEAEIITKEKSKFTKKLAKDMETCICFGIPNSDSYSCIGFGKHKLSDLAKIEKGREAISNLLTRIKSQRLKEGEKIFNKNLDPIT